MSEWVDGPQINPIPPKARAFQGIRAGVVSRTSAGAIDYAVVLIAVVGSYAAVRAFSYLLDPRGFEPAAWTFGQFMAIGFVAMVVYLTVSFGVSGRTVGDRVMGLRVVGPTGERVRWVRALIRAVLCAVFPVGLFWCAVRGDSRSFQDIVLHTSVIHEWPAARPAPKLLDPEHRRLLE